MALHSANDSETADLQIVEIKRIPSGPDRGKIAVVVAAIPYEQGKRPPRKRFRVDLKNDGHTSWSGYGKVKNMLFGWGDIVVTPYRIGTTARATYQAVVNAPGGAVVYPEGEPNTRNTLEHTFNAPVAHATGRRAATGGFAASAQDAIDESGEGDFDTRVTAARVVREGSDWQVIRVTYDLNKRDADKLGHEFYARVIPGADSASRAAHFDCSGFHQLPGQQAHAFPGRGRVVEYLCRLNRDSPGPALGNVRVALLRRARNSNNGFSPNHRVASNVIDVGRGQGYKHWSHQAGDSPQLPDFTIPQARIIYTSSGRPRSLEVTVRNDAGFSVPSVTLYVGFINNVDGVVLRRPYEIAMHGSEGRALLNIAGDSQMEWRTDRAYGTGFLNLYVNRISHTVESDFDNNQRRVPVANYYPAAR